MVPHAPPSLDVVIVSANARTVDELARYLTGVGLAARGCAEPSRLAARGRRAGAVVLFPDELEPSALRAALAELRRRRPDVALVFVTSRPHEIEQLAERSSGDAVLPKPSFGWAIVDALRAAAARGQERDG